MSLCNNLLHPVTREPWPTAPIYTGRTYLVASPDSWIAQWGGDLVKTWPDGCRSADWSTAHPLGCRTRSYEAIGRNGAYQTAQAAADALWHREFLRLTAGLADCARAWRFVHGLRAATVGPMTQHGTLMVMRRYLAMQREPSGTLPNRCFEGMGLSMWSSLDGQWDVGLPRRIGNVVREYVRTSDPATVIADGLTTHEANIKAALCFIEGVDCAAAFFDHIQAARERTIASQPPGMSLP